LYYKKMSLGEPRTRDLINKTQMHTPEARMKL